MTESKADTSRKRILDAATEIAIEQGPKVLTLDNVAKRCGMSKGGVMHHFKNKDALLAGMVESMIGMMKTELCEVEKAHADALPVTNLLRTRQRAHEKLAVHQAKILLVAAVENPSLLSPMLEMMQSKREEIEQHDAVVESTLLWLAADGLSFQELMDISPFTAEERIALRGKLINRAIALEEARNEHQD